MDIRTFETHHPDIAPNAYIDPLATVIGEVSIGKDSSVWPHVSIRGDMHYIQIGEGTSIQDGTVIHVTHKGPYAPDGFPTRVGNFVTVGHNVTLHGCTIDDYVVVGMGSIVLDGAIIQSNVLLAAGSLVPPGKVLESGFLYAGSPAQQRRPLTQEEIEFFEYSAQNYINLKEKYLAL